MRQSTVSPSQESRKRIVASDTRHDQVAPFACCCLENDFGRASRLDVNIEYDLRMFEEQISTYMVVHDTRGMWWPAPRRQIPVVAVFEQCIARLQCVDHENRRVPLNSELDSPIESTVATAAEIGCKKDFPRCDRSLFWFSHIGIFTFETLATPAPPGIRAGPHLVHNG